MTEDLKRVREARRNWIEGIRAERPVMKEMSVHDAIIQIMHDSNEWFPTLADDPYFTCLALAGEVGELANILKKDWRDGALGLTDETDWAIRDRAIDEATDVFIYLMQMFALLEADPIVAYQEKRAKNVERFGRASSKS